MDMIHSLQPILRPSEIKKLIRIGRPVLEEFTNTLQEFYYIMF